MSSDKKITLKRIIIYCFLAFLPLCVITPVLNVVNGGLIFEGNMLELPAFVSLYAGLSMLSPAVANILTRVITKEGIKNSCLCLNFKGNLKYYLSSILVPLWYGFTGMILLFLVFCNGMSFDEIINADNMVVSISAISNSASAAIFLIIPFFGEEFGWRAYLTPKMTELMPEPLAVLVSGIIWGLWHAPLTASGHNFGTDYQLFPFLGIVMMCFMCSFLGAFLTVLTKRTGSVIPASIAHGVNNQAGTGIMLAAFEAHHTLVEKSESIISIFIVEIAPIVLVGIVSYIILIRDYLKDKKAI